MTWDSHHMTDPETLELLLKDIYDVHLHYCSIDFPNRILPNKEQLFKKKQFLTEAMLTDLVNNLGDSELCMIIDRLCVSWVLFHDTEIIYLVGPFLLFSTPLHSLRSTMQKMGMKTESLSEFGKYQQLLPYIENNTFNGLIKLISRLILNISEPKLKWVELYQKEITQLPEETQKKLYVQTAYEIESAYIEAVYAGNSESALDALNRIQNRYRRNSSADPNALISSIYGNAINCTMARIAAYQAGVSPAILDELFQRFMIQSVTEKSVEEQFKQAFRMTALVCEQVRIVKTKAYSPLIQNAVGYIRNNYQKEIRLDHVANLLGIHKNYLSTRFTKETGMSFSNYLIDLRLSQAALRIKRSTESIGMIASDNGFQDQNYFARMFRRKFGLSPSAFRNDNERKETMLFTFP